MPADTATAGYPVHAVATFRRERNAHGASWLEWTGRCGATGIERVGFGKAGQARRLELCASCFPGRDRNACGLEKPQEIV